MERRIFVSRRHAEAWPALVRGGRRLCCEIAFRPRDKRLVINAAMFMRLLARTAAATHNSKRSAPSAQNEDIYLKGYADGSEPKVGVASWIAFFEWPVPASSARQQNADGGVARRQERPARREGCEHDGQRKSVAHMPTAATTTANLRYGRMIEARDGDGQDSN